MKHLVETSRTRRKIQNDFNKKFKITPTTIKKSIDEIMDSTRVADSVKDNNEYSLPDFDKNQMTKEDKKMILQELRQAMMDAASTQEFEKAAKIRDEILEFEKDLGLVVV